jgi:hypothetical protein
MPRECSCMLQSPAFHCNQSALAFPLEHAAAAELLHLHDADNASALLEDA